MLKFAAIFFAFLVPVAMSQTTTSGVSTSSLAPTCQEKCNTSEDSCKSRTVSAADDGQCVEISGQCFTKCETDETNACKRAANITYNKKVLAARKKFHSTKVTVDHAMANAQVVLNQQNINKAFPGLQADRDKTIKAAKVEFDQKTAACK